MRCKICSSPTERLCDKKTGVVYHVCNSCEFVFLDAKYYLSSEEEKSRYTLHENTMESLGYVAMFECFINVAVEPWVQPGASILDFGCGHGPVLAELLTRRGYAVSIYDPYFADDTSYNQKTYHLITMTEVIEHLEDPVRTVSDLKKSLKEQGRLAIMTQFNPHRAETFLSWYYRREDTHISFFSTKTFQVLAEALNMHIHYCDDKKMVVLAM
jgi:2-polyprenyl-3-methyl-5-hydroxy-6-metoxy-1,4-benzoquinol methylase